MGVVLELDVGAVGHVLCLPGRSFRQQKTTLACDQVAVPRFFVVNAGSVAGRDVGYAHLPGGMA